MSRTASYHTSACDAVRRHNHRRPRIRTTERDTLAITTPEVAARLLAEGVPATDLYVVAAEVERCIGLIGATGDDICSMRIHSWTDELVRRYGDKLATLTMTTRGKVTP